MNLLKTISLAVLLICTACSSDNTTSIFSDSDFDRDPLGDSDPAWEAEDVEADESPDNEPLSEIEPEPEIDSRYAGLVINELAASGLPTDWFEIYNGSGHSIDLSELMFTDDIEEQSNLAFFPEGDELGDGAYAFYYLDDDWPGFHLSQGEELAILTPEKRVIDAVDWSNGDSPVDASYGRIPDTTGSFMTLDTPTPGQPNVENVAPGDSDEEDSELPLLYINEVAAAGSPYDWFELFNGSDEPIDLARYRFSDDLAEQTNITPFPNGVTIEPGGFFYTYVSDVWPGFKLGSNEELGLYTAAGDLVDSVDWNNGDSPPGKSFGRIPDGTGEFVTLNTITPGSANVSNIPGGDEDEEWEEPETPFCTPELGCPWEQGCLGDRCGACRTGDDCPPLEGCLADGSCGVCTDNAQCATGHACTSNVCVPTSLPEWRLTITEEDWSTMLATPSENIWVPCAVNVDGTDYSTDTTCRLLGGSSRTFSKKSLRIEFSDEAPHPGYARSVNLRAEYDDPSFMRTFLGYESFRRLTDIPSPRTEFVKLYLNGFYYGLMLQVENIDETFLEARKLDTTQSMYEADPPSEFALFGIANLIPLPDESTYRIGYNKKTGTSNDYDDLIYLIEEVIWQDYLAAPSAPMTTERTAAVLDMDRFMWYLSMMAAIQNADHVRKNYYLTQQVVEGRGLLWQMFPWDLNLTFGCHWTEEFDTFCNSQDPNVENPYQMNYEESYIPGVYYGEGTPTYGEGPSFYNLLIHLAYHDPERFVQLQENTCEIVQGTFWNERLPQIIDGVQAAIRQAVIDDPNDLNLSPEAFDNLVQEIRDFTVGRKEVLEERLGCP